MVLLLFALLLALPYFLFKIIWLSIIFLLFYTANIPVITQLVYTLAISKLMTLSVILRHFTRILQPNKWWFINFIKERISFITKSTDYYSLLIYTGMKFTTSLDRLATIVTCGVSLLYHDHWSSGKQGKSARVTEWTKPWWKRTDWQRQ